MRKSPCRVLSSRTVSLPQFVAVVSAVVQLAKDAAAMPKKSVLLYLTWAWAGDAEEKRPLVPNTGMGSSCETGGLLRRSLLLLSIITSVS
jgi:hypothetical protein